MEKQVRKALLVSTLHRGVFFGYGIPSDASTIRIEDARMCIYWSKEINGMFGLACTGPNRDCRIGPAVPAIILRDVTSVTEVTPEAEEAWRTW